MMAAIQEQEKSIVHDALQLLKHCVAKSHLTSLSKLPRNGKAPSNVGSDAAETKLVDRLQGIDRILERLTASPTENDVSTPSQLEQAPYRSPTESDVFDTDEEPYLNPFTGQFVFPPSVNAPGPSEIRRTAHDVPRPVPSMSFTESKENESYRNTLGSGAVCTVMDSELEDLMLSPSDPFMRKAPASNNKPASALSTTTPYSDGRSNPEVRPKDLSSILSEFDDYFSCVSETPQSSKSSLPQATSASSVTIPSVARTKGALHQAGEDRYRKQIHRRPVPISVKDFAATPSVQVMKKQTNHRDRWHQHKEGNRTAAERLLEQDHTELAKINADYQLALELAEGFPQDFDAFRTNQSSMDMQRLQDLRDIEEQISRQDQEVYVSEMARLQAIEDDWNRSYQQSLQAEQALAQQIVEQEAQKDTARILKELQLLQDRLQAEEDGQIAADRALALSLSHEPSPATTEKKQFEKTALFNYPELPPPYVEHDMTRSNSSTSASITDSYVQPVLSQPIVNRVVHDFDHNFQLAQKLHDQWEAELQAEQSRHIQAVKAVQQEIQTREAQSRRDHEFARSEDRRHRREQENQRQEEVRLRVEQEQKRKAGLVECTVCSDEHHQSAAYRFPCTHAFCRGCLAQTLQTKLKEKSIFQCCKNRIDMSQASQILSPTLASEYGNLVQELDTPNPVYCSGRGCSTFIPPANIKGGSAVCPKCRTSTCASCKKTSHIGVCQQDRDGQALLQLGSKKGWKSCPKCGNMVERRDGCLHMTCRCGQGFCYSCGKSWSVCQSKCKR